MKVKKRYGSAFSRLAEVIKLEKIVWIGNIPASIYIYRDSYLGRRYLFGFSLGENRCYEPAFSLHLKILLDNGLKGRLGSYEG